MPSVRIEVEGFEPIVTNLVPKVVTPPPPDPVPVVTGIWIDPAFLLKQPTNTPAWNAVLNVAKTATATGTDYGYQDDDHSRQLLAAALAGTRLGGTEGAALIATAKAGLDAGVGTELSHQGRWLAMGRQMPAATIAANVLGLTSGKFYNYLLSIYNGTLKLDANNEDDNDPTNNITLKESAFSSGSNASIQEGFLLALLAALFKDKVGLDYCWDCYKRYVGDTTAIHKLVSNSYGDGWQVNNTDAGRVGIIPAGASKNGLVTDGAVANDIGRSNAVPKNPLTWTSDSLYPWVGLNGASLLALVLHRQGYPAFEVQNKALLRAYKFMRRIAIDQNEPRWWEMAKKEDAKWVLAKAYGLSVVTTYNVNPDEYPIQLPVANHDLVGFVDWTHPTL